MKIYWSDKAGFVIDWQVKVNFDAPDHYFQTRYDRLWRGERSRNYTRLWLQRKIASGHFTPFLTLLRLKKG